MPGPDFDIDALYTAIEAERERRGISWAQLTREVNRTDSRPGPRPISPSTITGMRRRRAIEGDGVLQMLLWLKRTPESFIPGRSQLASPGEELPILPSHQILRFDTKKIYAAVNERRLERSMTWKETAAEIGAFTESGLRGYEKGGRTAFPDVVRIAWWLGRPVASLTRTSKRVSQSARGADRASLRATSSTSADGGKGLTR